MTPKRLPSRESLLGRLRYDPATGVLTWLERSGASPQDRSWNARYAGTPAGSTRSNGYVVVGLDGKFFSAHRLAWLMANGDDPGTASLDHANLNRADNRIENLRLADRSKNTANTRKRPYNTCDYKGITREPGGKWRAQIRVRGRLKYLGLFVDPLEAHEAYCRAASEAFGEFARFA